jgi:hypothetical protein
MGRYRVAVCGWQLPRFEPNVQLTVSPIIEEHKSTRVVRVPQYDSNAVFHYVSLQLYCSGLENSE